MPKSHASIPSARQSAPGASKTAATPRWDITSQQVLQDEMKSEGAHLKCDSHSCRMVQGNRSHTDTPVGPMTSRGH